MFEAFKSILIWIGVGMLVLVWLPLLAVRRLLDRDPACYGTGHLFRRLGKAITRINPNWRITISGRAEIDDRKPYVVVCNHLSQADIPLISCLPWEMKWVAKKELFEVPVLGWMMRLAGDIAVDRKALNRKRATFRQCRYYLNNRCSVMFFPEGTRSRNGKLNRFTIGAFELAIREQVPVLPLVIDGTQNTLPARSWKFGMAKNIRLKILSPLSTEGKEKSDTRRVMEEARSRILQQLAEWRNTAPEKVDNLVRS